MFYAHIVLAKKGPLARIWLAAHWDKKLTKAHVFETNIEQSVDGIMQPKVKLALRTSGHLLLGVVRIYSRKAKYLLADCNEAFVKIKMAFRPGMVDLPEGHREANVNAITLPEVFHDFDTALPELNDIDIEAQFSVNQSRADEITMREDYGSLSMSLHDDGFGDMFDGDTPDMMRGGLDPNVDEQLFEKELHVDVAENKTTSLDNLNTADVSNSRLDGDGFGDEFGQPELFEDDLFGEPALAPNVDKEETLQANVEESDDEDGVDQFDTGAPSPMSGSSEYRPTAAVEQDENEKTITNAFSNPAQDKESDDIENVKNKRQHADEADDPSNVILDQSTLIQNEDESFALAPIDASAYKGVTKSKRKRKLIVDEVKNISGEEMKAQLANTADIVTTLDLAPPTKRLMYWKETGGVEKLFALPSRSIPARTLFINYQRHLVSHFSQLEDFSCLGPSDLLALDHIQHENDSPSVIQNKRGRKRKQEIQAIPPAVNIDDISAKLTDVTSQSLAPPECVREVETEPLLSHISLDLGVSTDGLVQPSETSLFDAIRSPAHVFSMNDLNGLDQMPSIADIPLTPNLSHGINTHEHLNPTCLTPSELNHGHMTPHHSTIENIESIPNLPADQVSSILNEAENMPDNADYSVNRPCDIATDWNDYDFPPSVGMHNATDEQMENETDEQFEERVLNKRAAQMFFAVKNRISKQEYLLLSELTIRNSRKQVLAALRFYATGCYQRPIGEQLGIFMSQSSISRSIHRVTNAINDKIFRQYVRYPMTAIERQTARSLFAMASEPFSGAIGAIDCTHVAIIGPPLHEEAYINHHGYHSINVQMAAQKFYSLLVLKKFRALNISQSEPYAEIIVTRGPLFDNPKL